MIKKTITINLSPALRATVKIEVEHDITITKREAKRWTECFVDALVVSAIRADLPYEAVHAEDINIR